MKEGPGNCQGGDRTIPPAGGIRPVQHHEEIDCKANLKNARRDSVIGYVSGGGIQRLRQPNEQYGKERKNHTQQDQTETPEMRGNDSMFHYIPPFPKEERIEQKSKNGDKEEDQGL